MKLSAFWTNMVHSELKRRANQPRDDLLFNEFELWVANDI